MPLAQLARHTRARKPCHQGAEEAPVLTTCARVLRVGSKEATVCTDGKPTPQMPQISCMKTLWPIAVLKLLPFALPGCSARVVEALNSSKQETHSLATIQYKQYVPNMEP